MKKYNKVTDTPQQRLMGYLTRPQWSYTKIYLGVLKPAFQIQLCNSLIDYLETGAVPFFLADPIFEIFNILTGYQEDFTEYTIQPLPSISDTRDPREGISPNAGFDKGGRSNAAILKAEKSER